MLNATAARFADLKKIARWHCQQGSCGQVRNHKQAKVRSSPLKDEIEAVGHIPLLGLPVSRFMSTQHYSRYYLYAEHDGGANTLDITKMRQPSVSAHVAHSPEGNAENLLYGAGIASLVNSEPVVPASIPQTLRITDFSDPNLQKLPATSLGLPLLAEMIREDSFSSATAFRRTSGSRKTYTNYILYGTR
jgi:hypothetical protein